MNTPPIMGEIHELNPVGDPQRTITMVACFDGEPNDKAQAPDGPKTTL
jgi:hypothetical protein